MIYRCLMRQTFTHVHWMRKTFTRIHKMSDASNIYTYTPISFKRQVVFHWSSRLPVFSFTNSHALNQRQSLNTEGTHGSFPFTRKPRTGKWPHALTAQRYNLWASLVQQRPSLDFSSQCLYWGFQIKTVSFPVLASDRHNPWGSQPWILWQL